jgi:hypothetical protein
MNAMLALVPPRRPAMPAIRKEAAAIRYITAALRRVLISPSFPGSVFSTCTDGNWRAEEGHRATHVLPDVRLANTLGSTSPLDLPDHSPLGAISHTHKREITGR